MKTFVHNYYFDFWFNFFYFYKKKMILGQNYQKQAIFKIQKSIGYWKYFNSYIVH